MSSFTSSPIKTLRTRLPPCLKNTSATFKMARFSSMERYWSTPVIPVVFGAISEVMRSKVSIQYSRAKALTFSKSKTSALRVLRLDFPKVLISWMSTPSTNHSGQTIRPITCMKLPGALAMSYTFIPGWMRLYFSCISMSLNALRARYPSFLASRNHLS